MGRFLDGAELKRIGSLVQHNLSFLTVSGSARAEYERIDRLLTGRDAVRVKVLDSDFIAGYTRVPGVFGGNAGILMVTKSRELIKEARFATWLFSIVCGTSVALLISYYLLARKRLHAVHQIEKLSHERMQAIIDLAVDGIFIIDAGGKILSHNVRSCEITGLTSEEMGLLTLDRLFTDGNADLPSITRMLPAGTETVTSERELKKRDGTSVVVEMRVKRMPDASLQCFMRDITERKAMEQGLVEQRDIISSMAAELSLAEERERCRIAGELHDQVAPTLLLGKMKLASLGSSLDAPDHEQALAAIGELIDRSVEEIRSLTFQMRPPILANAGLEAALRWLGEEFRENYGLEVVILNDPTTKPLNYETRSTLFQIVRELLLNITKHAGTPQATVSLSRTETMITVRVEDRGKGFDVNGSTLLKPKSGGFGIFNAQKKIEFLGGSLTIDSVPGEGTVAEISAPLDLSKSDGE